MLILPDGSKSLIPAAWTDFRTTIDLPHSLQLAGSFDDLLRLRSLVDTLLLRCSAVTTVTSGRGQESHAATESELPRHSDSGDRCLWEQFDDEQKRLVIETLTRLIVKLTQPSNQQEQTREKRTND